MASAAPANQLPILYNGLEPLSSNKHGNLKLKPPESVANVAQLHAVPLTLDEFVSAQRHYPIVFSVGDNPVPLALMGLNEGVNAFVDESGRLLSATYVPAYIRRYPFMLARIKPDAEELSLCFDPESGFFGEEEGTPLFEGDQPSETTKTVLKFCEEFEMAAQRTSAFMRELTERELLIDGEVSIQPSNSDKPFIYRGFKMVSEEKMKELRGDELRKMNQNGMLPLVMAHLFSLPMIREIFAKQQQQGKGPKIPTAGEAPATAEA